MSDQPYEYFDIFKAKKVKKGILKGTNKKVYFEVDPLTKALLRDPYYEEHESYRIAYNHILSKVRAGVATPEELNVLSAQPGPQWYFLRNEADVIIYGGEHSAPSYSNVCRTIPLNAGNS